VASRDLRVTLIGDDKTGKAFGSAGKNADGIGSKFAAVGKKVALAFGGMAIAGGIFAKSGVDAFARVEDATGAAEVQFGAASKQVVAFAQTAAKNFGISTGAALDAANTFGTMGKAAGLSGQDLASFSTDFAGLAGDLASFKGTSPEQAIEAIGAALRGETEPIRAYGVLLDDASMRQEALKLGLISTTKNALTPQQKVLAAQSLIYKQTSDAQGDFARTSDSTANTAKRLAAETENASARLGEQLAPAVTAAREAFLGLIQSASRFVDYIGPAVKTLMTAFSAFWAALREGDVTSDGLVGAFERVGDTLHRVGQVAIPVLVGAFEAVKTAITSVVGFFAEHERAAKALGAVAAAVGAAVIAAWTAQAAVATAKAARSVLAWFTTATASTTSATIQSRSTAQIVVGWLAASVAAAANAAKVVAGWVLMGAQSLIQAARMAAAWVIAMGPVGWVIAAVVGLVALIVANWDTIKKATAAVWEWVVSKVKGAWEWIVGLFQRYHPVGIIISHWDAIKRTVSNGVSSVVSFVTGLPGRITSALGNLGSLLLGAGADLIRGFINGIKNMFTSVKNTLGDLTSKLTSWKGPPSTDRTLLKSAGQMLIQGFIGGMESQYGGVRSSLQGLTGDIAKMAPVLPADMLHLADTQALGRLTGMANSVGGARSVGSPAAPGTAAASPARAAVHIENYNEARRTPHEVAADFVFLARTGG
jgi:hypothetical protein